jgi:3,4-dihydroxy 2-butanone 4-phosphate synthase/GTP cyclohydrolase II
MRRISEEGCGVIVYLHQSTPGLRYERHGDKLTLAPHARGTTYPGSPDGQRKLQHEAGIGAQILADLGLRKVRLITNHPRKIIGLEAYGIEVVAQEPLPLDALEYAGSSLNFKRLP